MRIWNLGSLLAAAIMIGAAPAAGTDPLPLDAYGELPSVEEMAISASGNQIAVVALVEGKRRLLILDAAMKVLKASNVGDLKVRSIEWAGDESVLLTNSETQSLSADFTTDSYEAYRASVIPAMPGGEIKMVFNDNRNIVDSVFGTFGLRQVKGKWVGFFGGVVLERGSNPGLYVNHTRPTLFGVTLEDNKPRKASQPAFEGDWRDWLVSADGEIAATFDIDRQSGAWQIAGSNGKVIASGKDPDASVGLVSLGKDGSTLIYSAGDADDESIRWFELPLTGGEPMEVFPDDKIKRLFIGPYDGKLLGFLPKGANPVPVFFNPTIQERAKKVAKAFPKLNMTLAGWNTAFDKVLVKASGSGNSGTWYLVDLAKMKADPIGYERPSILPDSVGPISNFSYNAGDGLELDGILTLPPDRQPKNLPVILFPHGGPNAHDEAAFDWWAQAFASRGYAVFQPNFRGSTNRNDAFLRAGNGQWGRKMQSDISDGLDALAKAGIADPSRACIMGASYGGYAALAGVTLQQGLYKCAVAVAPVSDLTLMYDTELRESGRSSVVKNSLRRQLGPRNLLEQVSPRRAASGADAPILLIHGRDDTVVPYEQSKKMADALKDAGKPYEFVELKDEDHWLSRAETRKQMLAAAMAFVQKNNPAD